MNLICFIDFRDEPILAEETNEESIPEETVSHRPAVKVQVFLSEPRRKILDRNDFEKLPTHRSKIGNVESQSQNQKVQVHFLSSLITSTHSDIKPKVRYSLFDNNFVTVLMKIENFR